MRARVLFFGILKEVVGKPSDDADFPDGANLGSVFDAYAERFPALRQMAGSIVAARNHEFADFSTAISDGDEVAFLPPVSGGAPAQPAGIIDTGNIYALTRRPIDLKKLSAHLLTGAEGAVVTFEGTVRNNTRGRRTRYLDYECYEPMALKMIARIGSEIAAGREIGRRSIVHRLGRVLVGETSIAIIVTAPHRRPAFEAAMECIDRLKASVPIWKKERFEDGEAWVEGEWGRDVPVAR